MEGLNSRIRFGTAAPEAGVDLLFRDFVLPVSTPKSARRLNKRETEAGKPSLRLAPIYCSGSVFIDDEERQAISSGTSKHPRLIPALVSPLEHQHTGRAPAGLVHGQRQDFAIGRKHDLLSVDDLAVESVGYFKSALIYPPGRIR